MEINFLAPHNGLSGGLKIIVAYGNALLRRGHHVSITYTSPKVGWRTAIRRHLRRAFLYELDHLDHFQGELINVSEFEERYLPNANCLVATNSAIARKAANFDDRYGQKFYLIQGYDTHENMPENELASYYLPFHKMVTSECLRKKVMAETGETDIPVIPVGRDFQLSESCGDGVKRPFDIGMIYSRIPAKCAVYGLDAIRRVQEEFPYIKIVMFGAERPNQPLPDNVTFFERPQQQQIRNIYLSTRVWISSSVEEGFSLPALEAMSLGAAVVAANSKGIEDLVDSGRNGFLVDPYNSEGLADKIKELLVNHDLLRRIQLAGLSRSEDFSWNKAADQFEANLLKHRNRPALAL